MILNTGDHWHPEDADIIAWERTYPAVDVPQELRAMESWCDANPTKRKTKTGIKRFVNAWLARAQNKGGSPQAKAQGGYRGMRSMTVVDERTDVSWVEDQAARSVLKQKYLAAFGQYWDGERKTA